MKVEKRRLYILLQAIKASTFLADHVEKTAKSWILMIVSLKGFCANHKTEDGAYAVDVTCHS